MIPCDTLTVHHFVFRDGPSKQARRGEPAIAACTVASWGDECKLPVVIDDLPPDVEVGDEFTFTWDGGDLSFKRLTKASE